MLLRQRPGELLLCDDAHAEQDLPEGPAVGPLMGKRQGEIRFQEHAFLDQELTERDPARELLNRLGLGSGRRVRLSDLAQALAQRLVQHVARIGRRETSLVTLSRVYRFSPERF